MLLGSLAAAQAAVVAVLVLGDIGFDKPGRFGLDFGHLLLLLGVQVLLLVATTGFAFARRRHGFLLVQALLAAATVAAVAIHG